MHRIGGNSLEDVTWSGGGQPWPGTAIVVAAGAGRYGKGSGAGAAASRVMHFGDEAATVIERYDRRRTERRLVRVHQEDVCQVAGTPPTRKYENRGVPGARKAIELLRAYSGKREEDVSAFVDALIFNWLIVPRTPSAPAPMHHLDTFAIGPSRVAMTLPNLPDRPRTPRDPAFRPHSEDVAA